MLLARCDSRAKSQKNHNHPERTNTIEKCTNDYYIWKIIKFSADRKN